MSMTPPPSHKPADSRGRHERQAGFTLLLAALVASIVLGLGAAIYEIAQKEVSLSSIGRDSQFAFYAADTAAECALYWDFRCNYFATSTASVQTSDPSCATVLLPPGPTCDTQALGASGRPGADSYPYTMTSASFDLFQSPGLSGGFCAQVSVHKELDPVTQAIRTTIHADGYNVDCASIFTSSRALQRTVELNY